MELLNAVEPGAARPNQDNDLFGELCSTGQLSGRRVVREIHQYAGEIRRVDRNRLFERTAGRGAIDARGRCHLNDSRPAGIRCRPTPGLTRPASPSANDPDRTRDEVDQARREIPQQGCLILSASVRGQEPDDTRSGLRQPPRDCIVGGLVSRR